MKVLQAKQTELSIECRLIYFLIENKYCKYSDVIELLLEKLDLMQKYNSEMLELAMEISNESIGGGNHES